MSMEIKPIIYVTRDIERALGMPPSSGYLVVSSRTPYGEEIKKSYPESVILVDSPDQEPLGTGALLEQPAVQSLISSSGGSVLVFKNTARIEPLIRGHGWQLLNPPAALSEQIENKMSQVSWLGELGRKYLPNHIIRVCKNLHWEGRPAVIQWAHGHTGDGTLLVRSEKELKTVQEKFPERMARVSDYIVGPSFTVNIVVGRNKILIGNISYQITGLKPFTENEFSTIGNDWSATASILTEQQMEEIENMARDIGTKLNISGWRGLCGLDVIHDIEQNRMNLIEINARQPASATFESILQTENRRQGLAGLTVFEAHLQALRGEDVNEALIQLNDGAQIVQRITTGIRSVSADAPGSLELQGYTLIPYANTELNADLLRIQSAMGIMESHNKLNKRGKEIQEALTG